MHAGGGLFSNADDCTQVALIEFWVDRKLPLDRVEKADFFFALGVGQQRRILGGIGTKMQQQGCIATVVQNHVGGLTIGPLKNLVGVVPVFIQ